ncbi:MAG: hypothetical protein EXR99_01345 [Gemmataceae bacterium]|nr:hypothetical protein [Gemmataceae bacterium]
MGLQVWKIGGSLLPLADLPERIVSLFERETPKAVVLVMGGGEKIRELENANPNPNGLKEHWAAIEIMRNNAEELVKALPGSRLTSGHCQLGKGLQVLDPLAFCLADHNRDGDYYLPENRGTRSDSIALRLAILQGASRLVLVKSKNFAAPGENPLPGLKGYFDPFFFQLLKARPPSLEILAINFRSLPLGNLIPIPL